MSEYKQLFDGLWSEQYARHWNTFFVKNGEIVSESNSKYRILSCVKAWLKGVLK